MRTRKPHPRDRYFRYLARLNRGGRSNMYGAIPYLAAAFGLDREAAFQVICEWVDAQAAAQAVATGQPPFKAAAAPAPAAAAAAPVPPESTRGRRTSARSTEPRTRVQIPGTRRKAADENPPPVAAQRVAARAPRKPAPASRQPAVPSRQPSAANRQPTDVGGQPAAVRRKPVGVKRKRPGVRRAA